VEKVHPERTLRDADVRRGEPAGLQRLGVAVAHDRVRRRTRREESGQSDDGDR